MVTIHDIDKSQPVLILYSSGTGGEFITHTLSKVSNSFNNIMRYTNTEANQTHLTCVLDYSAIWADHSDTTTWITNRHLNNVTGNKRYLIRDHPGEHAATLYNKHLPNLQVLHLTLQDNYDYYAKLTFAKLAKKIDCSAITFDFVKENVSSTVTNVLFNRMHKWASAYKWVWLHELHILNDKLKSNASTEFIEHVDSLESHIQNQHDVIKYQSTMLAPELNQILNNYVSIDITNINSSRKMWTHLKQIITDIDLDEAIRCTDIWQQLNKELIEREF